VVCKRKKGDEEGSREGRLYIVGIVGEIRLC